MGRFTDTADTLRAADLVTLCTLRLAGTNWDRCGDPADGTIAGWATCFGPLVAAASPAQRPFYQQLLAKRGGDPSTLDWSDTVVDVTPGTYQVTYHGAKRGFDPDPVDDVIWAHIERMPDAPPHRKEHHEVS